MGFSSVTGQQKYVFADNASFDGTERGGGLTTNGQLWIGNTSTGSPTVSTLTAGTGMVVTNSAGGITLSTNGATVPNTITGDTGGALSPTAGNFNLLGSGSITTAGSGSTLTTQLTGLTNHAVLVGAGTTTITKVGPTATAGQVFQSAGAAADPTFSTATYPSTATGTGTILRADGTNWVATTNTYPNTSGIGSILAATSANVIGNVTAGTNGQVLVGSTGAAPVMATLSSTGGTITYTTGAGTLNLEAAGTGGAWVEETGATRALLVNQSVIGNRGSAQTFTLPTTAAKGSVIRIVGVGAGFITIAQNAGESIRFGSSVTTVGVGGSLTSTVTGDSIELLNYVADDTWVVLNSIGNWTVI